MKFITWNTAAEATALEIFKGDCRDHLRLFTHCLLKGQRTNTNKTEEKSRNYFLVICYENKTILQRQTAWF